MNSHEKERLYEKYVDDTVEALDDARGLAARYRESLQAIADGALDPQDIARQTLKAFPS